MHRLCISFDYHSLSNPSCCSVSQFSSSTLSFPVFSLLLVYGTCFIHHILDKQLHRPGPQVITMIPVGRSFSIISFTCGSLQLAEEGLFHNRSTCIWKWWLDGWYLITESPQSSLPCSCWKHWKSLIGNQGWWSESSLQRTTKQTEMCCTQNDLETVLRIKSQRDVFVLWPLVEELCKTLN